METYFPSYFPPTLDRSSVLFHYPNSTERASGELSLRKCPPPPPGATASLPPPPPPPSSPPRFTHRHQLFSLRPPFSFPTLSLSPVAHSPARTEEQKEEEEERVRPIRPHTVSSSDAPRRNIQLGLDTGLFFSGSGRVGPKGSGSGRACIFRASGPTLKMGHIFQVLLQFY